MENFKFAEIFYQIKQKKKMLNKYLYNLLHLTKCQWNGVGNRAGFFGSGSGLTFKKLSGNFGPDTALESTLFNLQLLFNFYLL